MPSNVRFLIDNGSSIRRLRQPVANNQKADAGAVTHLNRAAMRVGCGCARLRRVCGPISGSFRRDGAQQLSGAKVCRGLWPGDCDSLVSASEPAALRSKSRRDLMVLEAILLGRPPYSFVAEANETGSINLKFPLHGQINLASRP